MIINSMEQHIYVKQKVNVMFVSFTARNKKSSIIELFLIIGVRALNFISLCTKIVDYEYKSI